MRPTPQEVIDGIRRVLKDVIEPDLSSDFARTRLREIRSVLAQVDWNDSTADLARQNRRLGSIADRAAEWLRSTPDGVDDAALADRCDQVAPRLPVDAMAFDDHQQLNDDLGELMIDLEARLRRSDARRGGNDGTAVTLMDEIRRAYTD